ncbi:MAG: hypothetical protein IIA91_05350 [Chloroflexi bacterium]|nr:hypothetical protein [Chloroflexota bacterium]
MDAETSPETTTDHVFVPKASRVLHFNGDEDKLYEVIVVAWKLYYERPQWLGWLGKRTETRVGAAYLPVDAESLALYRDSSKEEGAN